MFVLFFYCVYRNSMVTSTINQLSSEVMGLKKKVCVNTKVSVTFTVRETGNWSIHIAIRIFKWSAFVSFVLFGF